MTVLEQLRKTIEDGHPGETEKLVREALKQHIPAGRIVEEAMTPAMRTVGENYKSNGADIIKILAAARSVRKGFELLEEQDSQFGRRNIGTVILGTVEGDLHDVGKNLVAIMFRSAGFKFGSLLGGYFHNSFTKARTDCFLSVLPGVVYSSLSWHLADIGIFIVRIRWTNVFLGYIIHL